MNLLAVDTSGPVAGVGILRSGQVAYEGVSMGGMNHSISLMPMIEEALTRAGMEIEEIDLYAAVTGPGSFTGVRIGVNATKGMAHGAGKPCIGIDALEALAAGTAFGEGLLCPILDARAGQVYGAAFSPGIPPLRRMKNVAAKLSEYLKQVLDVCDDKWPLYFLGDGVSACMKEIQALVGSRAHFLPAHLAFVRPGSVLMLAQAYSAQAVDYLRLKPQYLRAPQAERERIAKLQQMEYSDLSQNAEEKR